MCSVGPHAETPPRAGSRTGPAYRLITAVSGSSFRFRLERVRVVRERKEKLAQRELAHAISRRSSTVEELRSAEDRLESAREQQRNVNVGGGSSVSARDLLAHQVYVERTEAQRRASVLELEAREAEVAQRDADLTSAASEHQMLERLRDRRRREHNREALRRELGALDEIATARAARSRA